MSNVSFSTSRNQVLHNYHDHAQIIFPSDIHMESTKRKGAPGGVSFPAKLHTILSSAEQEGLAHIISWQPHGRSFVIHKPKDFVAQIMPTNFRQTKITSFQRQLNLYGFSRITVGRDHGGYYHEKFLRHKLFLCQGMFRVRIKGNGTKGKANPETEPDFYSMSWMKPEAASASRALKFDPRGEATRVTIKENKPVEPNTIPSTNQHAHGPLDKKKQYAKMHFKDVVSNTSQRIPSVPITPSAFISPEITIKEILVSSSIHIENTIRKRVYHRQGRCSIWSREGFVSNKETLHPKSGISPYEKTQMDNLDPLRCSILEPCRTSSTTEHNCVEYCHFSRLSESSLSVVRSLQEPILSPSSSSSSLSEMVQQGETLEINADTFFL